VAQIFGLRKKMKIENYNKYFFTIYVSHHLTFGLRLYEEKLTGQPHDTSVQKATSDNENVDAV